MNIRPRTPRIAVILLQLGGLDSLAAVRPYLKNFFSDQAIIGLRRPLRWLVATGIAAWRTPIAREIYQRLGGRSPILEQTERQRAALEAELANAGAFRCFIVMRYWHPFADAVVSEVAAWASDEAVLLPLYPQFSTTTSGSAIDDWQRAACGAGLSVPDRIIREYPTEPGFIEANVELIQQSRASGPEGLRTRLLFTAHGLPEAIVRRGDPYPDQLRQTAQAIIASLGRSDLDWKFAYQSRATPQKWLEPSTTDEIKRAGDDGVGLVLVPLAFVSEHSETLVELEIEYAAVARQCGVPFYRRVPTVGCHPRFIAGLARLVTGAVHPWSCAPLYFPSLPPAGERMKKGPAASFFGENMLGGRNRDHELRGLFSTAAR